jgi:hypothetical protein
LDRNSLIRTALLLRIHGNNFRPLRSFHPLTSELGKFTDLLTICPLFSTQSFTPVKRAMRVLWPDVNLDCGAHDERYAAEEAA